MNKFYLFLLLFLSCIQSVSAKNIQLITIGPGDEFWSVFGHTAIAVDDDVYGFGYFSFADEGLIASFFNNEMYYDLGVSDLPDEIQIAQQQNRTFIQQELKLSASEEAELIRFLKWHNLPENQSYHYDYFLNNCSTKIRDLINDLLKDQLFNQFNHPSSQSFYDLTFPAKNQSLMNFGMILGYGWEAYQERSHWELMAFPHYFYSMLNQFNNPQIQSGALVYQAVEDGFLLKIWKTHAFMLLFFFGFFILLLYKKSHRLASKTLWVIQSIIGIIILVFWLFSGYSITSMNFNLLLFSPLAILLSKYSKLKYMLLLSYVSWAIVALIVQAWYFFPIWLLHIVCLMPLFIHSKNQKQPNHVF